MKKINFLFVSLIILSGCNNKKDERYINNLDTVNNILYNCIEEYNKVLEYEETSILKEGSNSINSILKFNDNKKEFYYCISDQEEQEEIYAFFQDEYYYELDNVEKEAEKKLATGKGIDEWLEYRDQAYSNLDTIVSSEITLLELIKPLLESNREIIGFDIVCDSRDSISFSIDNYEIEEGIISFEIVIENYLLTSLSTSIDNISSSININYSSNIILPNIEDYEIKDPLKDINNGLFN